MSGDGGPLGATGVPWRFWRSEPIRVSPTPVRFDASGPRRLRLVVASSYVVTELEFCLSRAESALQTSVGLGVAIAVEATPLDGERSDLQSLDY